MANENSIASTIISSIEPCWKADPHEFVMIQGNWPKGSEEVVHALVIDAKGKESKVIFCKDLHREIAEVLLNIDSSSVISIYEWDLGPTRIKSLSVW